MRTTTRARGYPRAGLHFKSRIARRATRGLLALALLVGLSQMESGGRGILGTVGGLLIGPVEAHRPSRLPRVFGRGGKSGIFQAPGFMPLPHGQAFAPSLPTKDLPRPKLPAFQPPPLPPVLPPVADRPLAVKLPPVGHNLGSNKPTLRTIAGLPPHKAHQLPPGDWNTLVKPVPAAPRALPPLSPSAGVGSPRKSFRRFLEKLDQHAPKQAPATKPRETAKKNQTNPPVPRRLGGRAVGELLPPIGTFKAQEVLAINLTAEELAKARAGDFQVVGQTALPGLGVTLTHLLPPASLNAVSGRERLFDLVPDGGFVLNRVYAPYRLGSGRQGPGSGATPVQQQGGGCPSERCFGSALIKWQPQLAACARNLKIGIVDTAFDKAHPALAGLRYDYKEFLPDGRAKASPQHGTGVLALLAGKSDSGTPGLIPDATFAIANAFFDDAEGQAMSDTAHMARALDWLKRSGAAIINLSFAGPEDDVVHHAVRELTKGGAVVVAAAGNDGPGAPPSYPAAYEEVIAVTAVDRKLSAYRYAGRGAHIDLSAPGVDVWTAMPGRREGPQTGTSFAVPYVTAVVAVAVSGSAPVADGDALSPKRHVLAMLQDNVINLGGHGRDATFGEGLVQAPDACRVPPPIVADGPTIVPPEPWAGTVLRTAESGLKRLAKDSWAATVRPVSGEGSVR